MDATADDWLTGSDDGEDTSSGLSDFQDNISEWGNRMQDNARARRQENAKQLGRFAEKGASEKGSAAGKKGAGNNGFTSAVNNAKDAEKKDGFANNVQGKTLEEVASKSMPGGRIIVNQAKKLGPLGTILIVVMAVVGIFAGSQTLAPFGLIANGLDQFNNLRTSMNRRQTYFRRFKLDRTRNKPITRRATIFNPEHFKVSKSLEKKLAKNRIFYIDTDDFECRFLVYEDPETGKRYAVAANDDDVGKLPSSAEIEIDGKKVNVDFDERVHIDDAIEMSEQFSRDLDKGTRTLKGHIAGWFDDLSEKLHFRIGSSRNKFKDAPDDADEDDIKKRAHTAEEGGTDKGLSESIAGESDESDTEEKVPKKKCCDKDGKEYWDEDPEAIGKDHGVDKKKTKTMDDADIQAEVDTSLKAKARQIVGGIGVGANVACTALKVYAAMNVIIAGIHVANVLNYVTGLFEAIQKTQTGDAGKSELAMYMNSLSERGNTVDSEGNVVRENTNSLESTAWNQFFSSGELVVQANDPLAEKFNKEYVADRSLKSGLGGLGEGIGGAISALGGAAAAYRACLYVDMAATSLGLVIDVVLAFFTAGIGNVIKELFKDLFKQAALTILVTTITSIFMSFIPHIAKLMAMDLIENMAGEDAAYAINSGFNMYTGSQMQMSSGLPATEEKLMAHWREQQEVIAEEGAYERSQRSPFDPTSKYTFLGSIVNSLMPIANTMSSPLTTISKTMNTVSSYAANLLPTAKADGEVKFQTSLNYDCPNLKQINLVGDAFCNPYFVTDFSTMAADPSDVIDYVSTEEDKNGGNGNFIWDGYEEAEAAGEPFNPEINPKGELGKWVVACAVRDSQFGTVDDNVMNAISLIQTGNSNLDTVVNTGISMIPVIGDIKDIYDNANEAVNFGWATGEKCIADEYKYYSRYSEDQRVLESEGLIEQSAVAKFLDDYYEKNPIDNSYEGQIARYTGMTKEKVEETLAYVEAFEWLAEYNPENYGPEKFEPKPDGSWQYESNEIVANAEQAVVGNYIVFDDLRTKTKIA